MKTKLIPFIIILFCFFLSCGKNSASEYQSKTVYTMKNDTIYNNNTPVAIKIKSIDRYDNSKIIYVKHL